jgi:hypothetical protein
MLNYHAILRRITQHKNSNKKIIRFDRNLDKKIYINFFLVIGFNECVRICSLDLNR